MNTATNNKLQLAELVNLNSELRALTIKINYHLKLLKQPLTVIDAEYKNWVKELQQEHTRLTNILKENNYL